MRIARLGPRVSSGRRGASEQRRPAASHEYRYRRCGGPRLEAAAAVAGWGGPELLATYEIERARCATQRPSATENFVGDRKRQIDPAIARRNARRDGRARTCARSSSHRNRGSSSPTARRWLSLRRLADLHPRRSQKRFRYDRRVSPERPARCARAARGPHRWALDLDLFGRSFVPADVCADPVDADRIAQHSAPPVFRSWCTRSRSRDRRTLRAQPRTRSAPTATSPGGAMRRPRCDGTSPIPFGAPALKRRTRRVRRRNGDRRAPRAIRRF